MPPAKCHVDIEEDTNSESQDGDTTKGRQKHQEYCYANCPPQHGQSKSGSPTAPPVITMGAISPANTRFSMAVSPGFLTSLDHRAASIEVPVALVRPERIELPAFAFEARRPIR